LAIADTPELCEKRPDFVAEQRANAMAPYERLVTPREEVYPFTDPEVAARLGVLETG
jgi:hypothetical protein